MRYITSSLINESKIHHYLIETHLHRSSSNEHLHGPLVDESSTRREEEDQDIPICF